MLNFLRKYQKGKNKSKWLSTSTTLVKPKSDIRGLRCKTILPQNGLTGYDLKRCIVNIGTHQVPMLSLNFPKCVCKNCLYRNFAVKMLIAAASYHIKGTNGNPRGIFIAKIILQSSARE